MGNTGLVVGVDPGPVQTAIVCYNAAERHIEWAKKGLNNAAAMQWLANLNAVDVVAVEWPSYYGTNCNIGETILRTAFWIGRFRERLNRSINYREIKRQRVKALVCGTVAARDANVRQALMDMLGAPGTKKAPGATYGVTGDAWAALAVAVAWSLEEEREKP